MWSGLLHSILEMVDPVLNQRIGLVLVVLRRSIRHRCRHRGFQAKCAYELGNTFPFLSGLG